MLALPLVNCPGGGTVDAAVSKTAGRKAVRVRIPSRVPQGLCSPGRRLFVRKATGDSSAHAFRGRSAGGASPPPRPDTPRGQAERLRIEVAVHKRLRVAPALLLRLHRQRATVSSLSWVSTATENVRFSVTENVRAGGSERASWCRRSCFKLEDEFVILSAQPELSLVPQMKAVGAACERGNAHPTRGARPHRYGHAGLCGVTHAAGVPGVTAAFPVYFHPVEYYRSLQQSRTTALPRAIRCQLSAVSSVGNQAAPDRLES
jgi:hypothetical protein